MLESGRGGHHEYVELDPSGRYGRFKDVLGKGAMKTVYRAFDELLGIEVAWNQAKICDVLRSPEALEYLYSEVHLLSTLNHDCIMHFYTSWIDSRSRTFNFITELFTSGTLREYRQKYKHVDIRAVKNWARQILHGLVYLHGHEPPVIHRDLKCDNIFINGNLGQVKIGDLGLAAVLRDAQPARSVIGTPEFMAPELYDEQYNELVDVYSFGMCVLEMLTAKYPYSECWNPAQIYKKVISGKFPSSLDEIQNREARRFISRCLVSASKRPSAKELLSDRFLDLENITSPPPMRGRYCTDIPGIPSPSSQAVDRQKTVQDIDMKITGKMNPDDDTIFLRVHFAGKDGHSRNIYFPFDIINDTPIDVANEMVKELDISERKPSTIAEVIDLEISSLVPNWKDRRSEDTHHDHHHVFSCSDEDDGSSPLPLYYFSSPSSQRSCLSNADTHGKHGHRNNLHPAHHWVQGKHVTCSWLSQYHREQKIEDTRFWLVADHNIFADDDDDDDTSSHYSFQSDRYTYVNCNSSGEQESDPSPRRRDQPSTHNQKVSRYCPEESTRPDAKHLSSKSLKQCGMLSEPSQQSSGHGTRKPLVRNKSLVDMRSQLLHKTLVEEVNKRTFNTVGTLESIGYQHPSESSCKGSKSRGVAKNSEMKWSRGY